MSIPMAQNSLTSQKPDPNKQNDIPSHGSLKKVSGPLNLGKIPFSILPIIFILVASPGNASIMDWVSPRKSKENLPLSSRKSLESNKPTFSQTKLSESPTVSVPNFFSSEVSPGLTGENLDLVRFVETHWNNDKKNLQLITQSISNKLVNSKCSDIAQKLCIVDVQSLRESLKSSALGISGLLQGNKAIEKLVSNLLSSITAPNQETLRNLQNNILKTKQANDLQINTAKLFVSASENLISIGGECYQTLELIPKLAIDSIDLYVQGSKQLVRQIKSNGETLKGLLLNVQDACDQINSGLDLLQSTITSTLRFSDHFAFNQFPLVNLPVPTREKLFLQIRTIQSSIKGINNTLSIADSQIKNYSQQLTHVVQGMVSKIQDVLRYQTGVDFSSGNLPQILGYTQNQICGLFQRTKDGISEMKRNLSRRRYEPKSESFSKVSLESSEEMISRKVAHSIEDKLPLFLLGDRKNSTEGPITTDARIPSEVHQGSMKTLYSDKQEDLVSFDELRPEEADILKSEIESSFPPKSNFHQNEASKELFYQGIADSWTPIEKTPKDVLSNEESYSKSEIAKKTIPLDETSPPESELLRMESLDDQSDPGDLIPMPKLDAK